MIKRLPLILAALLLPRWPGGRKRSFHSRFGIQGFTLVELLVSMTIFMVISSIMVANFRKGAQRDDLRQGALLINSLLQQAQAYALSGYAVAGTVPTGGYGVYLNLSSPTQVIFFADSDGGGDYDSASEFNPEWRYTLPPKVVLQSLTPTSPVTFTFRPPQGTRYLNGVPNSGSLTAVVQHQQSLQRFQVTASVTSGQINITELP